LDLREKRKYSSVRAEIATLGGLSAHADRAALVAWLRQFRRPPARTFVVQGESETALGFGEYLNSALHWNLEVPSHGEAVNRS
jgi:metallo-beta-lactamase family protein